VVKSADKVQIDHPDDPENKTLTHSTVSSDKMMNIYNGNIILDENGKGEVVMPDWFESFNIDFRYQLTAIGAASPNLHVAKEISNGKFEIAGGQSGMKVSWEITGIRNDNYAKANPVEVVKEKRPIDKGYYINPESFGKSIEIGIDHKNREKKSLSN
jgi:hypothetical protein